MVLALDGRRFAQLQGDDELSGGFVERHSIHACGFPLFNFRLLKLFQQWG